MIIYSNTKSGYMEDCKKGALVSKLQALIGQKLGRSGQSEVRGQNEVVRTLLGGGMREVPHPSYQALSYAEYLKDYNESVRRIDLGLHPCSLLHNYQEQDHDQLFHPKFSALLKKSPSFTARHIQDLQAYIRKYIQRGDQQAILVEIEHGKIKPSKSLQDSLSSMLKGNQEFIMLYEQKVVYEQALYLARLCQKDSKRRCLIIKGGFI